MPKKETQASAQEQAPKEPKKSKTAASKTSAKSTAKKTSEKKAEAKAAPKKAPAKAKASEKVAAKTKESKKKPEASEELEQVEAAQKKPVKKSAGKSAPSKTAKSAKADKKATEKAPAEKDSKAKPKKNTKAKASKAESVEEPMTEPIPAEEVLPPEPDEQVQPEALVEPAPQEDSVSQELAEPEGAENNSTEDSITEDPQELLRKIASWLDDLSGPARRRRQEASHELALVARRDAQLVLDYVDEFIDALYRPEAQTRWEVLDTLSALVSLAPDAVAQGYAGAEASLFDEASASVRLAAFRFLARLGATSEKLGKEVWPALDEAIQCYHGDPEYRDMLSALLEFVQGSISTKTKKAVCDRVLFDAKAGRGYIQTCSLEIVAATGVKVSIRKTEQED